MQVTTTAGGLLFLAALALGTAARADEWDLGNDSDVGVSTDNVLFHGSSQVHDLAGQGLSADVDLYKVANRPFSSYEFVVDGQTGDLDLESTDVQRLDASGTLVTESAAVDGGALTLRWHAGAIGGPVASLIRVQGASCGAQCGAQDRYRVRFYESTYVVPRFNNTSSQTTLLIVANATSQPCVVVQHYLRGDGSLISSGGFIMQAGELLVLPPLNGSEDASGSIRVAHTCGYGGLSGKAVSIEPATGFTFDTPLLPRPH